MHKTVVITGATGLIGKKISAILADRGNMVVALTRNKLKAAELLPERIEIVEWDYSSATPELINVLSGTDAVLHLAGENIFSKRWNSEHKKNIYNSRVKTTKIIVESILESSTPPSVFISASAVGFYGIETAGPVDETTPHGNDFLALLTRDWEEASAPLKNTEVRRVNIRTGIVLDKNEGALAKMLTPFKFFIGGPLGSGRQPFPWIHIDDICALFIYALDNNSMCGAYNGAAPETITMKDFCRHLGKQLGRPSFMNVPAAALKILYGDGAETLLKGTAVLPKLTLESGFKFKFNRIEEALKNLI